MIYRENLKANGCNTHLVIKMEDAEKYLTGLEFGILEDICKKIETGRLQDGKKIGNEYYICNKDELYANEIYSIIKKHENETCIMEEHDKKNQDRILANFLDNYGNRIQEQDYTELK